MSVSLKCAVLLLMSFTLDSVKASDLDDVISELYEQYKDAVADENYYSSRRLFKRNKQYELHVQKLKEVNGLKYHNLVLREKLRNDPNEYIYISNPLESKMPKAFLTIEEFKQQLTNRIVRQRLTTTLKTTLSTKPKVKANRKKRTQLSRYTKSRTSSRIISKSTISSMPVKGNKYDNKSTMKNNGLYPTNDPNKINKIKSGVNTSTTYFNKHVDTNTKPPNSAMKLVTSKSELSNLKRNKFKNPLKALTKTTVFSNTLLNVSRKTKDALRRKTTIQSITPKNVTIKRQTPTTEFRYFKSAIMKKLTTSTRTPILKSTSTNKTTVKIITINLPEEESTFKDSDTTTSVTLKNNYSIKEKLFTRISVGATTEDASTTTAVVHIITSKKDLSTETIPTSKEISTKELILKNTTTEQMSSKREDSTTERFTTATDISLKDPTSEYTSTISEIMLLPTEDLRSASTNHTNEIFKRDTTIEDTTTEKVTTTQNIKAINEFDDNLNNKLLTTPQEISTNDSNLDNIFEILSVPKEIFGKESTFENTTINMWTTTESSTKNLKSLLRLADTMMKSYKSAKRTPRRKKKVRLIETTINTTKYKRLERPLVFMGGYGQPMNKYANNVNVIEFK